jgi:Ricin-type beta-trefoil lectin domain
VSQYRSIYKVAIFAAGMLAAIPAAAQYVNIVNVKSGLALMPTTNVMIQEPCNGSTEQSWYVATTGSSTVSFENQHDGMYLKSPSTANGAIIEEAAWDGSSDENWSVTLAADGANTVTNQYSGKVLDVVNGSTQKGAEVQQWQSNGNLQQDWVVIPAGQCDTAELSVTSSTPGANSNSVWLEYPIPANAQLTGLLGTLTLSNSENLFSEVLFSVGYIAGGCSQGSGQGPFPGNTTLWSYILKNPNMGSISVPVNYLPGTPPPLSNCLLMAMGGGPGPDATGDSVTVTMSLSAIWVAGSTSSYAIGIGGEFNVDHGGGTLNYPSYTGLAFATVYPVTTTSTLNLLWGSISDSTWDSTSPHPSGSWTASNNIYVYPTSGCTQFQPGKNGCSSTIIGPNGQLYCGPSNYYQTMPGNTYQLLNMPLSGSGIEAENTAVYSIPFNEIVYASQCVVALTAVNSSTGGAFDSESQVFMVLTPYN